MRDNIPELIFQTRADFRVWLSDNADSSEGVYLIFGKKKSIPTVKATEALEEALCFGWIDGVMEAIDDTKYRKYFAPRRPKSVWSVKNKKIVESLRERGLMTDRGERIISISVENGKWDERSEEREQALIDTLREKLTTHPAALEAFCALPPSTQLAEARWYQNYKSEERREAVFCEIVEKLERGDTKIKM